MANVASSSTKIDVPEGAILIIDDNVLASWLPLSYHPHLFPLDYDNH